MANVAEMNGFQAVAAPREVTFFATLRAKFQQYRLYRQTVNELSSLSNRELADLGLNRSGIKGTAIEVVYGN